MRRRPRSTGGRPGAGARRSVEPLFGLLVLDAERGVGKSLQAGLLDGTAAPFAQTVVAGVDAFDGSVDLVQKVPDIVGEGKVPLTLERVGAGVGVFLVE